MYSEHYIASFFIFQQDPANPMWLSGRRGQEFGSLPANYVEAVTNVTPAFEALAAFDYEVCTLQLSWMPCVPYSPVHTGNTGTCSS